MTRPSLILLLALLPSAFAQQTPPAAVQPVKPNGGGSIEQLMSAPFPSDLTAAPSGGHIAWVQNAAGIRNVWIATAPEYAPRQLTQFKSDDGQEIAQLAWSADAASLVFVRGGAPNREGQIPNPMSDPAGAEQSVWLIAAAGGGEPKKLGDGHSPAVAKSGRIAWLSKGQVMSVESAAAAAKAEPLFKMRGAASSLRWSPDGMQLAFISERGTHSYAGAYNVASKSLQFLAPSVDSDGEPSWSPDSKQIAFLRLPAGRDRNLFGPIRTGDPWSIQVADVATGEARQVFTAESGRGSVFRAVTAVNQILWTSTGQLVFPWERDGWLHLYSVPAAGGTGAPRLLTFGEFEVEDVRLSADGREVIYSSNSDDGDRRHLFRVPAAGGAVTPITSGKGIEWSPVMTSDGKAVAFFRSDAKLPARAAIMEAFGTPRDLMPLDFPADTLVEPQSVVITAADGLKIRCQLFLPPAGAGTAADKKPALLFLHGGSRRQMLLGWHYLPYYHATYAMNQWLAAKGYIVLSVNYRSGTGYGLDFREATNFGAAGAAEFNDVMGAGLYLQSRPDVDPKRIGLWGGSYGGYLTALGLARASGLFAAGVDIHGVHDWNVVIRNFQPSYNALADPAFAKLAFESSPLASVKTWRSPVLLIHGDDDRNVPFSETVTLAAALRKQGVEFEQLIFPDEIHGFLRHSRWLEVFRAAGDFLDRRLKARK